MYPDGMHNVSFHMMHLFPVRHPKVDGREVSLSDPLHAPKFDAIPFSLINPFVLTRELLPVLQKTASHPDSDVRIIVVREGLQARL